MSKAFSMKSYTLDNDLFINLSGAFDGSSAWQLANSILTRFHGLGKLIPRIPGAGVPYRPAPQYPALEWTITVK